MKDAGGIYLGELEVTAEKSTSLSAGATGGGATLSGRVSLEVANRGGTHFYLAKLDTENSVQQAQGPHIGIGNSSGGEAVQRTKARYVVYRVEQDGWAKLEKKYQPEAAAGAAKAPVRALIRVHPENIVRCTNSPLTWLTSSLNSGSLCTAT